MNAIRIAAVPAVLAVSAVLIFAAAPAAAQGTAQERSDCTGDAFRFCSAFIPNVNAVEACLIRNKKQLSPGCQREFAANPPQRRRRS